MQKIQVRALQAFDHNGIIRKGQEFSVSPHMAKAMVAKKLVAIVGEVQEDPNQPAGEAQPSSASQAG